MVSENYACAYKEVIEVLKHTKREDVNKIPKLEIILWRQNMKKDYNFKIDENKPIEDQNLSKEAKAVLANIFKKYWATDYQREKKLRKNMILNKLKKRNTKNITQIIYLKIEIKLKCKKKQILIV